MWVAFLLGVIAVPEHSERSPTNPAVLGAAFQGVGSHPMKPSSI
jgi:hypothetical protein